ncbi:hypothetical protein HNR08_001089 [Cellulomonas hominis]|uniref:Peptidase S8/S53 domain-containing protein n=3 Tax=Cellulomonas hominis TaxID=156981 RepID=A0A7W8WA57_9CELL|nr:S8 family serine peptidase [Cellulomonas hominis]MBB5472353.1 hypothetical protein [Cellulomonas hominis]
MRASTPQRARTRRAWHGLAAAATLGACALVAPGASAATTGDGLWYIDSTGIAEAHQVTTGAGVHIALIDGTINPGIADLAGTGLTVKEPSYCAGEDGGPALPAANTSEEAGHATSMASLLLGTGAGLPGDPGVRGVAPGASVTAYAQRRDGACYPSSPETGGSNQALRDAISDGADIIVVPGMMGTLPDVAEAIRSGVVLIASAGNEGGPVTGQPAESNGVVTTGSTDPDGGDSAGNPWGPEIGLLAPGGGIRTIDPTFSYYGMARGSSNSAMVTAGVVALAMSAHPEATSNQILQAVVRTTDGSLHEPARDEDRGFGALDVRQLMAVDPTTLPDVNPFIRTDAEARPSAEELGLVAEDAPTEAATAPASADEPAEDPAPEDGPDLLVTGAAVVGAALLVAAATATVLVLRRRRTATPTDPTDQQHGGQHHG